MHEHIYMHCMCLCIKFLRLDYLICKVYYAKVQNPVDIHNFSNTYCIDKQRVKTLLRLDYLMIMLI